jgi:lipopolysaccharide/colanic/teichoic acid biosynthesis glycosyltransferase
MACLSNLINFRAMPEAYDADGKPLPDEESITQVGRSQRFASLDELPQLFNNWPVTCPWSDPGPR